MKSMFLWAHMLEYLLAGFIPSLFSGLSTQEPVQDPQDDCASTHKLLISLFETEKGIG